MSGEDWRELANCAGSPQDYWFPEDAGSSSMARMAKKICGNCKVSQQCLQYALDNDEAWGIWGGLSARQRSHLRRQRSGVLVDMEHGTESAYLKHLRLGSVPCSECRWAHAKYVAAKRGRRSDAVS